MSPLSQYITLKKKEDLRVRSGHPWVFSNEISQVVGNPQRGDIIEVRNAGGLSLGVGLYHPHSLIAFRLLSSEVIAIDEEFFHKRIAEASALRDRLFPGASAVRLVHGEADFLPGLVVDRYADFLVVQTFSAGMDMRLPMICDVLEHLFHPSGIIERNEAPLRELEQLPLRKGVLRGTIGRPTVDEHGILFRVDLLEGQKTGLFLDQRMNRALITSFARGTEVLDGFCNDGGFALYAARAGASSVIGIDASGEAVQRATNNAQLNNLTNVLFEQGDMFERLRAFAERKTTFDVVVLDPPSFTKSRKTVQTAKQGYRQLHRLAFQVLRPGGTLLTASCSHHILPEAFLEIIHTSALRENRRLQQLIWSGASPDHPTLPGVPETQYLKFGVYRMVD